MIEETRTDHAFESLSAADELAGMIHRHFAEQAMMDRPNELKQARGESLSRLSAHKRKVWVFLIFLKNQYIVDERMIGSQMRFNTLWYEASDDTGLLGRRFNRSLYFTLKEGPQ